MCVKDIVVETCDTCLRYTPLSAVKIFGLRISNFTQIRMWLHPPVYHCRFTATFSRLGLLFSQLQPRLLHWPTSICAGVTVCPRVQGNTLLARRTGTTVLVEISNVSWCLEYSSCCDFLTLYFVCYMSIDCSGGLCLAQRVSAQILIYRVTSSDSPCPCAWHQQSLMLHVLAALCMTTYSMHTLVSCDPWITGSFSLLSSICWKSHLYYTCAKCVCVLCCITTEIGKLNFAVPCS